VVAHEAFQRAVNVRKHREVSGYCVGEADLAVLRAAGDWSLERAREEDIDRAALRGGGDREVASNVLVLPMLPQ
jgi:hypothetical protein